MDRTEMPISAALNIPPSRDQGTRVRVFAQQRGRARHLLYEHALDSPANTLPVNSRRWTTPTCRAPKGNRDGWWLGFRRRKLLKSGSDNPACQRSRSIRTLRSCVPNSRVPVILQPFTQLRPYMHHRNRRRQGLAQTEFDNDLRSHAKRLCALAVNGALILKCWIGLQCGSPMAKPLTEDTPHPWTERPFEFVVELLNLVTRSSSRGAPKYANLPLVENAPVTLNCQAGFIPALLAWFRHLRLI